MLFRTADLAHLLLALTLLIACAHIVGHLFARLRQPPVIGEIVGGFLLGPTVLGLVAPDTATRLFPASGVTSVVIGALYQFGLILLMFLAGGELRIPSGGRERTLVASLSVSGLLIPFGSALVVAQMLDYTDFSGPRGTPVVFTLVFGVAIAVTSIPVISRILLDIGILNTAFARVVLSVAVIEDVILYVILAVGLGLVQARSDSAFGLWALTGIDSVVYSSVYYIVMALVFFAVFLAVGGRIFRWLAANRFNALERRNGTAFRLVFLLVTVLISVSLGVNPVFGALVAGMSVSRSDTASGVQEGTENDKWGTLKRFSLAFFVPIYFAVVGLKLNLVHHFDVLFFLWFFAFACVIKSVSIWLGARLAREDNRRAITYAVAMNARGGPGIVLATVTFDAQIINEKFFVALVLLSVFSSQIAGFWLDRHYRRHFESQDPVPAEDGR